MIRLWHRIGMFRALSVLAVLVVGLVAGLVIADRQTQHKASAEPVKAAAVAAPSPSASESSEVTTSEGTGSVTVQGKAQDAAAAAATQAKAAEDAARKKKEEEASRSATRAPYPAPASCDAFTGNKKTGCQQLAGAGFGLDQMPCLEKLWAKESGWNHKAKNKSSGAYGIPQALPASKMASSGADYLTNPATQIKWGLGYIKGRYKTPCGAWAHSQRTGWY